MALIDWLQLSLTNGIGPVLAKRLVEAAGNAEAACRADAALLSNIEGIGPVRAGKLANALRDAKSEAEEEIRRAERIGAAILCTDDAAYPLLLREIHDPPIVLYVRGTLEPRDLNAVAIVGSRRCSHYGREQAERFGALLAGAGLTVVSGGARGVDSASHRGAMAHPQGRTIAVLGSGVDIPYPPENANLFDAITARGAVISEFALGAGPARENFPRRNRIISGVSRGVLIVEADERSGALITARQAYDDQGRPVFALPGRVDNPLSAGPHQLIRDGAILVARLEDILDGLHPLPANAFAPPPGTGTAPAEPAAFQEQDCEPWSLTAAQRAIVQSLSRDGESLDLVIEQTGLAAGVVLQELTVLTLQGFVRRIDGQRFARQR